MISELFDDFLKIVKDMTLQDKVIFIVSFVILLDPGLAWFLAGLIVILFVYRVATQLWNKYN